MKKRFMAALLCLCLLTGTFTAAYAGEIIADTLDSTTGDGYAEFDTSADEAYSMEADIYAQAFDNAIVNAQDVYKVEIVWGDMAFAWGATDEITKTWQPADHTYSSNANDRNEEWYLISDSKLTKLEYNTDGTYDSILTGTTQNYVLMFNHSNQPVDANVKITEIYQNAEDSSNSDNITAMLTLDNAFGTTAAENAADGGYDYALSYDTETGVIYSKENGTAAAAYVQLSGKPNDGVLNDTTPTTVARITITLSIPETDESDINDEGGEEI